jgi:hypothetical protein
MFTFGFRCEFILNANLIFVCGGYATSHENVSDLVINKMAVFHLFKKCKLSMSGYCAQVMTCANKYFVLPCLLLIMFLSITVFSGDIALSVVLIRSLKYRIVS